MSPAYWALVVLAVLGAADLFLASSWAAHRFPRLARDASGSVRGPLAWTLTLAVRLYRAGWSGRNAGCCRFEPSCSTYALTAVRRHGGVRGGALAAGRLLRCQPLSPGGYDPVPGTAEAPGGHTYGMTSLRRRTRPQIVGSRRGTRV